ncbi:MAG: hypothetical protein N4A40_10585 [Tissierellales bacterium]|jgi:signal transduction histidine kinase|nr:hypothetical protein [Tissierellales bacterium]
MREIQYTDFKEVLSTIDENKNKFEMLEGVLEFTEKVIYSKSLIMGLAINHSMAMLGEDITYGLFDYIVEHSFSELILAEDINSDYGKKWIKEINKFKYRNQQAIVVKTFRKNNPFSLLTIDSAFREELGNQILEIARADGENFRIEMELSELLNMSTHIDALIRNMIEANGIDFNSDDLKSYKDKRERVYEQILKIEKETEDK